ncbi:MAG: PDZ domain-containing protein [Chloroflexota bacterium]
MRTRTRNLLLMAAVLVFSVVVWSAVAAQDATEEPTGAATMEAPMTATEAAAADSNAPMAEAHPFLGVRIEDGADGVSVVEVLDGSAAADAGLQAGDVITAINGTDTATVADVTSAVRALAVGDAVSIDFTRAGETMNVSATLGEQMIPGMNAPQPRGDRNGRGNRAGQMFGLEYNSEDQSWTLTRLSEDSPLYAAGLREGDVITSVDGSSYDPARLGAYLMGLAQDATVTLSVERAGAAQDIQVNASDLTGLFMPGNLNFNRIHRQDVRPALQVCLR